MPAAPIMAFDRAMELVGKTIKFYMQEFLGYRGCLVFAESPCFRQERFTGGRYVQNMSPSRALGDCPVCGGSFEAVGPGGVLVHLLAFHPHSAEAHWVIDQLARSDTHPHGRAARITAAGSHLRSA